MENSITTKPQFDAQEALEYSECLETILTFGNDFEKFTCRMVSDEAWKQRFRQYCLSKADDPGEKKCLVSYFVVVPFLVNFGQEGPQKNLEAFNYSKRFVDLIIESAKNIEKYEIFSQALKGYCLYIVSKEVKQCPHLASKYYSMLGVESKEAFRKDFISISEKVFNHLPFGYYLLAQAHDCVIDKLAYFSNMEIAANKGCDMALMELTLMFFANPNISSRMLREPLNFERVRKLTIHEKNVDALDACVHMIRHGIGGPKMKADELYEFFLEYVRADNFMLSLSVIYGKTVQGIIALELCIDRYNELDIETKNIVCDDEREALRHLNKKNEIIASMCYWRQGLATFAIKSGDDFNKLPLDVVLRYHYTMGYISSILKLYPVARASFELVVDGIRMSLDQGWNVDVLSKIMVESYYRYAMMLYAGTGGPIDKVKALKYFELAFDSGSLEAKDFIDLIKAEQKDEIKAKKVEKKQLKLKKIAEYIKAEEEQEEKERQELARMRQKVRGRCSELRRIPLVRPEWVDYAIRSEEASRTITKEAKAEAREKLQREEGKAALKAEKPRPEYIIEELDEKVEVKPQEPTKNYRVSVSAKHLELFKDVLAFASKEEDEVNNNNLNDNSFQGHHGLSNIETEGIIEMLKALGCAVNKINGKKQGKGSHTAVTISRIDLNEKAEALAEAKGLEGAQRRVMTFPNKPKVLKVYIRNLASFLSELGYTAENVVDGRLGAL